MSVKELPASVSSALDKPGIVERFLKQQKIWPLNIIKLYAQNIV